MFVVFVSGYFVTTSECWRVGLGKLIFNGTDSMTELPACIHCGFEYTYQDGEMIHCPECSSNWDPSQSAADAKEQVRDANGKALADGDSVTMIKDLKVKGTSLVVKVGTKVKNIRIVDGDHEIDCKIDGIGSMQLKSEFVRKV